MAKAKKEKVEAAPASAPTSPEYTVLARRYRPQQFGDLVGQEPVAKALLNALASNRVAHAYLFTGARGVGKTSTARILAKALNCEKGPTAKPCDECEICKAITSGEDVDVLEIDGASNRGIDEVRELRRNVGFRPSRARYKIYIIDEVHMLTKEAFNALLKTLEEPPAHVKFIFATTEVQKIPVTILSRCQRFDFAGIGTSRIVERLSEVVKGEQMQADDDALEWVARRAGGSMRDAQSLLDQLLAFSEGNKLTLDMVHRLLGTANDDRIVALADAIVNKDAQRALTLFGQAADEGLQLGELLDQLLDYWRDLMIVSCAGADGRDLSVASRHSATIAEQAKSLGIDTILAGLDVLSTTKARLRGSGHGRVLIEMSLVRLSRLQNLVSVAQLAQSLQGLRSAVLAPAPATAAPAGSLRAAAGAPPPAPEKKNAVAEGPIPISEATLPQLWSQFLTQVGQIMAAELSRGKVTIGGPNLLVITFPASCRKQKEYCEEPTRVTRACDALKKLTSKPCQLRFELAGGAQEEETPIADAEAAQHRYQAQRTEVLRVPLVKRAHDQLGAQVVSVDEGFGAAANDTPERSTTPETEEA
jgi:DNA polymerase-3 subunit gamma/tau